MDTLFVGVVRVGSFSSFDKKLNAQRQNEEIVHFDLPPSDLHNASRLRSVYFHNQNTLFFLIFMAPLLKGMDSNVPNNMAVQ